MKITANQTQAQTLTRLLAAADRQHPVTITYTKADGTVTLRTIETYDTRTTKAGDIILKVMDRETGEARTFRLDRIQAYTVHRTAYTVARPATDEPAIVIPVASAAATVIGREIARIFTTKRDAVATAKTLRPTTPLGGMNLRLTKLITRTHRAARTTSQALAYRTRSGLIAAAVEQGHLIRTGDLLDRLGADDLKDGHKSWYGRHVKKAYVAAHGTAPVMVWAQHRTTGRWIHVHAYSPLDQALYVGLTTYKQTRHLVAADYARCA